METVGIDEAKQTLEDRIARAARGEEVVIVDPVHGSAALRIVAKPAPVKRVPGLLKDKLPPPPDDFFDPLSDEELKDWCGDRVAGHYHQ